jgi:hypothetical protein
LLYHYANKNNIYPVAPHQVGVLEMKKGITAGELFAKLCKDCDFRCSFCGKWKNAKYWHGMDFCGNRFSCTSRACVKKFTAKADKKGGRK